MQLTCGCVCRVLCAQEPRYCAVGTDPADCAGGGSSSGSGSGCPAHSHSSSSGGCVCDTGYHVNDAGNGCAVGGHCSGHSHVNAAGTACACDDGYRLNAAGKMGSSQTSFCPLCTSMSRSHYCKLYLSHRVRISNTIFETSRNRVRVKQQRLMPIHERPAVRRRISWRAAVLRGRDRRCGLHVLRRATRAHARQRRWSNSLHMR